MSAQLSKLLSLSGYWAVIIPLLTLCSITHSYAANYVINPTNTNVRFAIERFETSATTGGFYNVKGQLQYDPNLKTGNISLLIPISSLSTGNTLFNNNLKGPDFFDSQRFPSARFQSTKWYFNNADSSNIDNLAVKKVEGNLTLHGETHPVTLTATQFKCQMSSTVKKEVCSGDFVAIIDRTKWNINKYSLFGLTKNLNLNIQVEATRQ